jgi:Tol biopolymer transport system component
MGLSRGSVIAIVAHLAIGAILSSLACVPPAPPPDGGGGLTAPDHLHITGRGQVPPLYTLRWTAPAGVTIDHFNVFRSGAAITDENRAAAQIAAPTGTSLVVTIMANTGVQFFRVSAVDADGQEGPLSTQFALNTTARSAYLADAVVDGTFELFTVPLAGGTPVQASGVMTAGRSVRQFAWSPDARLLAFIADLDVQGKPELYLSAGSAIAQAIKISGPTVSWADVLAFAWSPDAQHIAFIADLRVDEVFDLYVVPAATAAPQLFSDLTPRRTGYDGVRQFAWATDGARIAFTSDHITDNLFELFVVATPARTPLRVSGPLPPIVGSDGVDDFAWAPDNSRIAYTATTLYQGTKELFTTMSIGGAVLNVSGPVVAGGTVSALAWSPASTQIAYIADQVIPGAKGLWVTGPDGSTPTRLVSGPTIPNTAVTEFAWSRDAMHLAFRGDVEVPGFAALYAVTLPSTSRLRLSAPPIAGAVVQPDWSWASDSNRLAYRGSLGITPDTRLLGTSIAAPFPFDAVPELLLSRSADAFAWSADATQLTFLADLEVFQQRNLYLAPASPLTGISTRLGSLLPTFSEVVAAFTSPLSSEDTPTAADVR